MVYYNKGLSVLCIILNQSLPEVSCRPASQSQKMIAPLELTHHLIQFHRCKRLADELFPIKASPRPTRFLFNVPIL